ncbi:MAG: hypothetical protein OEV42_04645 [Deltaproteobacteria bacterium]|nr:hypothetical protein [Deltaproteobacteria bacterium]
MIHLPKNKVINYLLIVLWCVSSILIVSSVESSANEISCESLDKGKQIQRVKEECVKAHTEMKEICDEIEKCDDDDLDNEKLDKIQKFNVCIESRKDVMEFFDGRYFTNKFIRANKKDIEKARRGHQKQISNLENAIENCE